MLFKNKLKKCVHLGTKIQIISDMAKSTSKNLHYLLRNIPFLVDFVLKLCFFIAMIIKISADEANLIG